MKKTKISPQESEMDDIDPSSRKRKVSKIFDKIASAVTRVAGRPVMSVAAFVLIIGWGLTGPLFDYSDTWQLFINTTTTIITFLMVFIIQQSQNKDTVAVQLKLNELIACQEKASNRLIDIEDLTSDELEVLKKFYIRLSNLAEKESDLYSSHSLDEASHVHTLKKKVHGVVKKPSASH